jgi:hypothetical protein
MIDLALWLFSVWVISSAIVWVLSVLIKMRGKENPSKSMDGLKPWVRTAFSIFPIGGLEVANWLFPAHPNDRARLAETLNQPQQEAEQKQKDDSEK